VAPALADLVNNRLDRTRMTVSAERREQIRDAVVAGLSRGTPLTLVLEALGCPVTTFNEWRQNREEIREATEQARDLGYDWLAHECLEIADDGRNDWMEQHDREGESVGWKVNGEHVLRSKLRIETRLRLLAKWDPRRYGDSKRIEVDAHVEHTTRHVVDSRSLTDEGRAALRRLLAEAQAQGLLPAPADDPTVIDVVEAEYHEVMEEIGEDEAEDDLDAPDD
jgi:hypothetical protein